MGMPTFTTSATLTSAGVTADVPSVGAEDFIIAVTTASIDTNVAIRIEGTIDGTNYFNCDYTGDTTITTNGTVAFNLQDAPLQAIRGRLVSVSGGTPSVTFAFSRFVDN
jgi:hypothetical protein